MGCDGRDFAILDGHRSKETIDTVRDDVVISGPDREWCVSLTGDIGISVYRGEIDSFHRSFHLGALDQDRLTREEQTACTFMQDKTISTSHLLPNAKVGRLPFPDGFIGTP